MPSYLCFLYFLRIWCFGVEVLCSFSSLLHALSFLLLILDPLSRRICWSPLICQSQAQSKKASFSWPPFFSFTDSSFNLKSNGSWLGKEWQTVDLTPSTISDGRPLGAAASWEATSQASDPTLCPFGNSKHTATEMAKLLWESQKVKRNWGGVPLYYGMGYPPSRNKERKLKKKSKMSPNLDFFLKGGIP